MHKSLLVSLACVCFILAFATAAGDEDTGNISVKVVTKNELRRLLQIHPDSVPLHRSEEKKSLDVRGSPRDLIVYSLGQRIRGDQRVAYKRHGNSWSETNDVQLELDYPDVGIGALISYIQIVVEQSNSEGQAYVVRGGIGQRYVTVVLEAVNTYHFSYEASIFGQD